jgi:hypothetical protein
MLILFIIIIVLVVGNCPLKGSLQESDFCIRQIRTHQEQHPNSFVEMGRPPFGIDLGKNSCSVAGMDAGGRVVFRKRASRSGVFALVRKHPGCVVAMEACYGAASSRADLRRERTRGAADVARVRAPLCQGAQER